MTYTPWYIAYTYINGTALFLVSALPTTPLNAAVNAKRAPGGGSITIRVTWVPPQNFDQFDIDHYDITVNLTSGAQHMTTACGECTNTMITVSESPNNMRMETTFSITIAAVNQCGETGPSGTASYTLSKLCCTTCIRHCVKIPL